MNVFKHKEIAALLLISLISACQSTYRSTGSPSYGEKVIEQSKPYYSKGQQPGRSGKLTEKEYKMAKVAWRYFENNYHPKTGLVNAVNNYPSTTLWDTASYLGALVTVRELGIINKHTFDSRLIPLLQTLNNMELYRNEVPNKVYNTITAKQVDYTNKPGEIGYSALDIGRFLIWMKIIKERYGEYADAIDNALLRWNYCKVVSKHGILYGAHGKKGQKTTYVQEGRLGYEEYAAKGFALWGFNTSRASKPEPYEIIKLFGHQIPYDARDPRSLKAHNYVVAESYVLDGIELNWDLANDRTSSNSTHTVPWMADFAQRIYKVQEARYIHTGILTARTEHQLKTSPYFVYDTIYTDGYAWNTITESGKYVPQYAAIALKGAIGMWGLWKTPYTDLLFSAVSDLYDEEKGFYEGRFENGTGLIKQFTANNNGIILETLLYKEQGKILQFSDNTNTRWDNVVKSEFVGLNKCLPGKR
ncbi:DUF3131 domain-containing protein [Thalassotalea euphylliae]|uniref:DUF3131 domain-containing protein n=1 Tax=Thalassotalea euphylliae TaxID=1655234 RepID=UPI001C6E7336|nr:DUF3131 domain-containing protein [Thalassotalea euphylliae]